MAIAGTQLNFFAIGAENGLSTIADQDPLHDWIVFVGCDDDLERGYACLDRVFKENFLVVDFETYGADLPEIINKSNEEVKQAVSGKASRAKNVKYRTPSKKKESEKNMPILQQMALSPYYGDIRLLQLSGLNQSEVLVIDFKTKWDRDRLSLSPAYKAFLDTAKQKVIEYARSRKSFIGHNVGFDLQFMRQHWGVKAWVAWDTMIMSQLLSAGILTYKHGLAACCERELGLVGTVDKTEQKSDFSLPLRNAQINYAGLDIVYTKKLFLNLAKKIKEAGLEKVSRDEAEFTPALVEINHWGLPVDLTELHRQIKWYESKLLAIELEFLNLYPNCNIKSSQQIARIVTILNQAIADGRPQDDDDDEDYSDFELLEQETEEVIEQVKKFGSSKADLALLSDHRVVQLVSDFRTLLIYLNYCRKVKDELICVDGFWRVSGSIRQLTRKGQGRTCSGSSKNAIKCCGVNIQNPPNPGNKPKRLDAMGCPNVRDIFKPPSYLRVKPQVRFEWELYLGGHEFYTLLWLYSYRFIDQDLPAAHLAIATYLSGETAMEEAARQKLDLHAITMFNVFQAVDDYKEYRHLTVSEISKINRDETHPLHKVFKPIRKMCKNLIYGGLNNQSPPTLQMTIKTNEKKEVPMVICEAMVNAFPSVLPKISALRDTLWKKANSRKVKINGHWYGTLWTDDGTFTTAGYKRRIYSFCKYNTEGKPYVPKGDIALCWLAIESAIMRVGITGIYREAVFENDYPLHLGLICHDEILAWCPRHIALKYAEIIKRAMLYAMNYFTGEGKIPYPEMEKHHKHLLMDGWDH